MAETSSPKKNRRKAPGPKLNRRRCRELAVQVLFCEYYNSGQLSRAVASVRATTLGEELSNTRRLLRDVAGGAKSGAEAITTTLERCFAVAHTGKLPKAKPEEALKELEPENPIGHLAGELEETEAALAGALELIRETNAYFGPKSFTMELLQRFHANQSAIKEAVATTLRNWRSERLNYEDWVIIHLGATELLHCPEVPERVVMDEYIEISKTFGANDETARFVNGILDQVNREHPRPK